jgi:hypothetical protein
MDAERGDWAERAARRVEARFALRPHRRSPMDRGLLLTARTDYRERRLSAAFEVRVVDADGAPRRVAVAEGAGRALLILPGLYASLQEGLFADLAELAARRGRTVWLVEDRLAAATLALTGGEVPSLARIGAELAAMVSSMAEAPDALALSAGAAAALAALPGTFARIATWSGALDLWETAESLARHPLPRFHYAQVHRRAFRGAGLVPPPLATVPARLAAGAPCGLPPDPLLVVHAADDPVVPADVVAGTPMGDGQAAVVLPGGAHLGFGTLVGDDVYLVPFEEEA